MDAWSRWLLEDRCGGDHDALEAALAKLAPIRDRVVEGAALAPGDVLLDVGTGDGLIGFAALDDVGPDGEVVFSDISADLLETCRGIAERTGVSERCRFVEADACDLEGVATASVDAVTTRSVLIYVDDKPAAFREFHRVLRRSGRLSLFEPINRTMRRLSATSLWGYDARGIEDLAEKLGAVFEEAVGGDDAAMLGFDEVDLVEAATSAGFEQVHAEVHVVQHAEAYVGPSDWETLLRFRPNPLAPTAGEALDRALDPEEIRRLRAHLEPQVVAGTGSHFTVGCFLQARAG